MSIQQIRTLTKKDLQRRARQSKSMSELVRSFGLNENNPLARRTLQALAEKYGTPLRFQTNANRFRYTPDQLANAVAKSKCYSDVCKELNITICSFNYKRIQSLCHVHSISTEHFSTTETFQRGKKLWTRERFEKESYLIPRSSLRQVMVRLGYYTGRCEECGLGDQWNGKPLTLEVDHINGINDDNRLANLRWLCPNCHTQTPTHKCPHVRRKNS